MNVTKRFVAHAAYIDNACCVTCSLHAASATRFSASESDTVEIKLALHAGHGYKVSSDILQLSDGRGRPLLH